MQRGQWKPQGTNALNVCCGAAACCCPIKKKSGSRTYLALTPAMAGVGRCHTNVRQVSAGVRQFGRGTWKQTHRHNPQTYM